MACRCSRITLRVVFFLFCCVFSTSDAVVTADDMKTHLTERFSNYDARVRPVLDQSAAVQVTVDLYLLNIHNFDSTEQRLSSTSYLDVGWSDEQLAANWSNAEINFILVQQGKVWLPDLALQNGFETLTGLGNSFINVKVMKSGDVKWKPYQVFDSSCDVDVTFFPFDRTTCELKFVIWSNPISLVKALQGTVGIDLGFYEDNSEWEILSSAATDYSTASSSGVTFSIELKRKPLFYLLNILIPVILLAVLNVFVFALPASSGEKTGFSVIVFLAFAVFMTIVNSELPQNSEKISTFSAYLFLITLISTLIVIITLAELRLFARDDEQPIAKWLHAIARGVKGLRCHCCTKRRLYFRGLSADELKHQLAEDVTWADVVDGLDFIFFWLFLAIVVIVTVVCCVIAAVGAW